MLDKYLEVQKFVERNHLVTVKDICDEFDISESTTRRLLVELEKNSLIKRIRGGATVLKSSMPECPINNRSLNCVEEKEEIAKLAVGMIKEYESILLMSGSTINNMASLLKEIKNITVITNSIVILTELFGCYDICVHFLGGTLDHKEYQTDGVFMENNLKGLRADKVFMSAKAVDLQLGLISDSLSQQSVYSNFLSSADKCVVLADHTKFVSRGLVTCLSLDNVDTIITDTNTPQPIIDSLREMDIEVIL